MAGISGISKLLSKGLAPAAATSAALTSEEAEASFGGIGSKAALEVIDLAHYLEKQGASKDYIWKATTDRFGKGAFKGNDGRWRVEFNDFVEKMRTDTLMVSGKDNLEHVQGFNDIALEYDLSKVNVETIPSDSKISGSYDNARLMRVKEDIPLDSVDNSVIDLVKDINYDNRQTIVHETQHVIQNMEGFQQGTNTSKAGSYQNYFRTAGEVEARNVERRLDMAPEDKRATPPWKTEDVNPSDKINQELTARSAMGRGLEIQALKKLDKKHATVGAAGLGVTEVAMGADQEKIDSFKQRALEAGMAPEKIEAYLASKFPQPQQPAEDINSSLTPEEIERARAAGYSEEQIASYQMRGKAVDTAQISETDFAKPNESFLWESDVPTVEGNAQYEFLNEEEVKDYAEKLNVDPTTVPGINAIYSTAKRQRFQNTAKDIVANAEEFVQVDRPYAWFKSKFSANADAEYERFKQSSKARIVELGSERGLQLQYNEQDGTWLALDEKGEWQPATPGFLKSMGKAKFEIAGGISGATNGVALLRALGPYGVRAQMAAGLVGGVVGAVVGDQIDYMSAAIALQEELDAKVQLEKALGTAQMSAVYDTLFLGAGKIATQSYKVVRQAYRMVKDQNKDGAYEVLKRALGFATDEQIRETINMWERLNKMPAPGGDFKEKALAIAPTTMPGGENILAATSRVDSSASLAVASEINVRAQSIIKAARDKVKSNLGTLVTKDLDSYREVVKVNFGIVKQQGEELSNGFNFDLEKIAIKPLIESKIATIKNPSVLDSLTNILAKVDNATTSRQFADLLDLRHTVNNYKFNKRINNKLDYDAINEVLASIDSEIERGVAKNAGWLKDWKLANKEYAQMKQLENNLLARAVSRKALRNEDVVKILTRHAPDADTTYTDVMSVLSPKVRADIENSIVDNITTKFTAGKEGEFRAIQFPELAKQLETFDFATPEAMRLKEVVRRMSEVYKNDIRLATVSGRISTPGAQTFLTDDPMLRAKMATMSMVFNKARQFIPGSNADILAMVNKTAKFLEEPLNVKVADDLLKDVQEDQNLTAALKRLQSEIAKSQAAGTEGTVRAKLFKDKSGKLYTTDGAGRTAAGESIPTHRIVTEDFARAAIGVDKLTTATLTKAARLKLINEGYLLIRFDNGQVIKLDNGVAK